MTPEEELYEVEKREVARRAAELLAQGVAGIESAAREIERQTGRRIIARRPQVLDARRPDLDRMTAQCRAWLDAVRVIDQWLLPTGDKRTLGAVLKTIPADQARLIRVHLVAAGVLPDDQGDVGDAA